MCLQYLCRRKKRFTYVMCVIFLGFLMWPTWIANNRNGNVPSKRQITVKPQQVYSANDKPRVLRKCTETTERKGLHQQLSRGDINNILVLGYFRGGTTMMLDVLSKHDNVFYAFEPIHFLSSDTYEKSPITFLNGTKTLLNKDTLPRVQAEMLMNWFSCNVYNINLSDLKSFHLHFHSRATRSYFRCQSRSDIPSCINLLSEVCSFNSNRILKVVRLRMSSTEFLLKKLCNLKIIYLVRDPRAILHSLLRVKLIDRNKLKTKANEICNDMLLDINSTLKLKNMYPWNIFVVKYEALTQNPMNVIKMLFDFSNLTFSLGVQKYVQSYLLAHTADSQPAFWTKSGNASKIASKWRHSITRIENVIIDSVCDNVYEKFGYKHVTHEQIKDMSVSLQSEPSVQQLFDVY